MRLELPLKNHRPLYVEILLCGPSFVRPTLINRGTRPHKLLPLLEICVEDPPCCNVRVSLVWEPRFDLRQGEAAGISSFCGIRRGISGSADGRRVVGDACKRQHVVRKGFGRLKVGSCCPRLDVEQQAPLLAGCRYAFVWDSDSVSSSPEAERNTGGCETKAADMLSTYTGIC
jgi:hypothetical protein